MKRYANKLLLICGIAIALCLVIETYTVAKQILERKTEIKTESNK